VPLGHHGLGEPQPAHHLHDRGESPDFAELYFWLLVNVERHFLVNRSLLIIYTIEAFGLSSYSTSLE
jgi:hypothetical protein